MILVMPTATMRPDEVAITSMRPMLAQANAMIAHAIIARAVNRPTGDAGASIISSAAGKNSRSLRVLVSAFAVRRPISSSGMRGALLQTEQGRVSAASFQQLIVAAVLNNAPAFDRHNPMAV